MLQDRIRIRDLLIVLLLAIILAFVIRTFFFEPAYVRGGSMEPTLQDRDRLLISKVANPDRFDVIVFRTGNRHEFVKRVIGLPGDEIAFKDDTLYINGNAYDEPYLDEMRENLDDSGPLTNTFTLRDTLIDGDVVPEGTLFVMGDNRRVSMDSRQIGAVPMEDVIGVTKMIFYPFRDVKIMNGKEYRKEIAE